MTEEGIEVTQEYQQALDHLKAGQSILLSGKAGTGKSTFIQWLDSRLRGCVVVAPTGIAASHVRGVTIHSHFGIDPSLLDPSHYELSREKLYLLKYMKFLVIDEISMVTANIIDIIDKALREARGQERPFGGVPVALVGDLLQLPPVVRREDEEFFRLRYGSASGYFYHASALHGRQPQPFLLRRPYRQAQQEFLELLDNVRLGREVEETIARINQSCRSEDCKQSSQSAQSDAEDRIRLTSINASADRRNQTMLRSLPGTSQHYEADVHGTTPFASARRPPAPHRLELKTGARVVFVKNDAGKNWVNGDLGEVTELAEDHVEVRVERTGEFHEVHQVEWTSYQYVQRERQIVREEIGNYCQLPLALGWAITIHKSQGMTLERMSLDLGRGAFAPGQLYVALSRARTLEAISLVHPLKVSDVRVDLETLAYAREQGLV